MFGTVPKATLFSAVSGGAVAVLVENICTSASCKRPVSAR